MLGMARKCWNIKKILPQASVLAKARSISEVFAQILLNRAIGENEIDAFLNPALDFLHDPMNLPDMPLAVRKIKDVLQKGKKILVAGDYDVDGVTSLAVFNEFIKDFPGQYEFYIPHRVHDGYGLSKDAVEKAREFGASLITAFDCGTNSTAEIELAKSLGIEVVVVDHHSPQDGFNAPHAFVNPKRKDSSYMFRDLSGAALAFKLLQALTGKDCFEALDLVALSIVCDVVPLKGENRSMLKHGMEVLRSSKRPAIKALCAAARITQENLTSFHLGFILGPRINASGRVAHAKEALDLFITQDPGEALTIAQRLCEYNDLRKNIEADILKQAEAIAQRATVEDYAIVAAGDNWHPGVLGIVASRLCEKYFRPAFVISFGENGGKGSGRSPENVNLVETLDYCAAALTEYGGHKKAAGIVLSKENLPLFKQRLNDFIRANAGKDAVASINVDCELDFTAINDDFLDELELLKPLGEDNPKALFATCGVTKKASAKKVRSGYSIWLTHKDHTYEAAIYDAGLVEIMDYAASFDILYSLEYNTYHNEPRLTIKDVRLP